MFEEAQKKPALLQVFINTVLGETWALQGDAPEWQRLYDRREDYRDRVGAEGRAVLDGRRRCPEGPHRAGGCRVGARQGVVVGRLPGAGGADGRERRCG